ncbi:MAG: phosphotransferase [Alphaproteobacteria bacterium]|nr:phosphotransferase [Alphaproteobacteria bacterium]
MTLPEHHRPAVARGLTAAFGACALESISPLSGGLSGAAVFRIAVDGFAYLLRIQNGRDAIRDPARGHACMKIAAEAGLAPRVLYACDEDGVAITDFIVQRPPPSDPVAARAALIPQLGQAVRALHAAPAFPPLIDYLDGVEGLIGPVLASGLPSPDTAARIKALSAKLLAAYRRLAPDLVSSHNDLNPGNIVHDGRRPWLVDWDAAFLADRYVDLAALANVFARAPADETGLLTAYFAAPPTEAQRARLFLARQISHLFHAMIFLSGAAAERPGARLSEPATGDRSLDQLHAALGAGEPLLATWEGRVAYGLAHFREAAEAVDGARFDSAVEQAR